MRINAINAGCILKPSQAKLQTKSLVLEEPLKTDEVCFKGRGKTGALIGGFIGSFLGPIGAAAGALIGAGIATADGEGTSKEYGEPPNPDDWPYYP